MSKVSKQKSIYKTSTKVAELDPDLFSLVGQQLVAGGQPQPHAHDCQEQHAKHTRRVTAVVVKACL